MGHFYLQDGTPFYEVPNKAKGGMRPARVTDARKVGALPSVTTILGQINKPGLNAYFERQTVIATLHHVHTNNIDIGALGEDEVVALMRTVKTKSREEGAEAARRGTAIHDAIEAYFKGKDFPKEHAETVAAVVDLLEEKCGPTQAWEAERWFASDKGYGGKVDLISPYWVIDFKTKPGDADDHAMYQEQHMQLIAYDLGIPSRKPRNRANIIVSRDIPGSVKWWEWDDTEADKLMLQFTMLTKYWLLEHGYGV